MSDWTKIKDGKLKPENIKAYTALGEAYCSIACESSEQAEWLRSQILEKFSILKTGREVKSD